MTKEEMLLFENVYNAGIDEIPTEDIKQSGLIFDKVKNIINKNEDLQQRIDKAIKYINSKRYEYGDIESQDCEDYDIGFDEVEKLLLILQGEEVKQIC